MNEPRVSVLLLTKNPGPRFKKILQSVLNQRGIAYEVLAVDDGSTDGTAELLKRNKVPVQVLNPGEFNHGRTRNLIASRARGELLAFLTHDSLPINNNWLSKLAEPFADRSVAGVFGRQIPRSDSSVLEGYYLNYLYPTKKREILMPKDGRFKLPEHFYSNANGMIRKSVCRKNKFPEQVIMSEDQWWAKEVLKRGYKIVYQPSAITEHSHDYNLKSLFKRNFDSGASVKELNQAPLLESIFRFFKYLLGELIFLIKDGEARQIPYALVREIVRISGFVLGQHYGIVPLNFRRAFSMHNFYWASSEVKDSGERWGYSEDSEDVETFAQRHHLARYQFASKFVKGLRVLDVASGLGYGSYFLSKSGAKEVVGVDIDPQAVSYSNRKYREKNLSFVVGDAERLEFEKDRFDVVVSFETIEHLPNHLKYIQEIKRVLVKDGLFIMSTPDKDIYRIYNLGIRNQYHISEMTRNEVIDFLNARFTDVTFYGQVPINLKFWKFVSSLPLVTAIVGKVGISAIYFLYRKLIFIPGLSSYYTKMSNRMNEKISSLDSKDYVYILAVAKKGDK